MKISEIARLLNGKLENFTQDKEIKNLKSVETATEDDITFLKNKKDLDKIKAGAVIVGSFISELNIPQIVVDKPDIAFYKLIEIFYPDEKKEGFISNLAIIGKNVEIGKNSQIHEYVVIKDNVKIGKNCIIHPFCYIGENVQIGDNCILYPNVVIYKDTTIGNNVIIHANSVIAADGFGYYQEDGKHKKIKHIGKVIIEDDVEIGANTTIDRAMLDETVIKKGTKIDNLVMIGHNCKVGQNTILVSQVGIAGSSKIGNNVILAGQVGVADHITIGDNVIVTAKSGVGSDLPPNGIYGSSISAIEWKKWKRVITILPKLPEILKKLEK
ncbi:UDP-3-O-(3-hydroxymyristoyl)glucosamine N-acyltransferase [Sulfurihydrogenibium sp.]|jgi:UDP-3-O-[3-hydroxymyristoyl] glucosamine N-acyltransferase|uniref:UDP-3-O-(3-hydroxymyristoyl)glucosamine N-acyltransferase n=1 Tax=Sulfurihydrogenibium sp. TaxID=2053621 RepID=UPI00260FD806|nr:UDP-3-O-(3-hydroxymyristoyl)glucosamine N-acyltransferase [Sulfurihydrogenibium sp.]